MGGQDHSKEWFQRRLQLWFPIPESSWITMDMPMCKTHTQKDKHVLEIHIDIFANGEIGCPNPMHAYSIENSIVLVWILTLPPSQSVHRILFRISNYIKGKNWKRKKKRKRKQIGKSVWHSQAREKSLHSDCCWWHFYLFPPPLPPPHQSNDLGKIQYDRENYASVLWARQGGEPGVGWNSGQRV